VPSRQVQDCGNDQGQSGAAESILTASYILGTPAYMPPEQCDGRDVDERGDICYLGCVLYALLA
jgi:eukaryotic-like serine/threonine-protein kinase